MISDEPTDTYIRLDEGEADRKGIWFRCAGNNKREREWRTALHVAAKVLRREVRC